MDCYITEFKNMVHTLREHNIGLALTDEDALHQFESGLSDDYSTHSSIRLAQDLDLNRAYGYYQKIAKKDKTLTGAIGGTIKKGNDTAHTTTEICRAYARGKCTRKNCRYLHPDYPIGKPQTQKFKGKCHYCGIQGHKMADCRKKKKEERQKKDESKHDSTITTTDSVTFDETALCTYDYVQVARTINSVNCPKVEPN